MDLSYILVQRQERGLPKLHLLVDPIPEEFKRNQFSVVVHLPFENGSNGLPYKSIGTRLEKMEDQIDDVLCAEGCVYVGRVTHNGLRRLFYYTQVARPSTLEIKSGFLKKEIVKLDVRHDPDWRVFAENLEVTQLEKAIASNEQLHQKLEEYGDIAAMVRPVDFGISFSTADQRSSFLNHVLDPGFSDPPFRIGQSGTWEPEPASFWCEITKDTSIERNTIAIVCIQLKDIASQYRGEFDGWACPVKN